MARLGKAPPRGTKGGRRGKGKGAAPPRGLRAAGAKGGGWRRQPRPLRALLRGPGGKRAGSRGDGRGWGTGTPGGEGDRPGERRSPFWNLPAGGLWGPGREQPGRARRRARHKGAEGKQAGPARGQGRPEGGGQGGWAAGTGRGSEGDHLLLLQVAQLLVDHAKDLLHGLGLHRSDVHTRRRLRGRRRRGSLAARSRFAGAAAGGAARHGAVGSRGHLCGEGKGGRERERDKRAERERRARHGGSADGGVRAGARTRRRAQEPHLPRRARAPPPSTRAAPPSARAGRRSRDGAGRPPRAQRSLSLHAPLPPPSPTRGVRRGRAALLTLCATEPGGGTRCALSGSVGMAASTALQPRRPRCSCYHGRERQRETQTEGGRERRRARRRVEARRRGSARGPGRLAGGRGERLIPRRQLPHCPGGGGAAGRVLQARGGSPSARHNRGASPRARPPRPPPVPAAIGAPKGVFCALGRVPKPWKCSTALIEP